MPVRAGAALPPRYLETVIGVLRLGTKEGASDALVNTLAQSLPGCQRQAGGAEDPVTVCNLATGWAVGSKKPSCWPDGSGGGLFG
jgi:hypothetical protein